MAEGGHCRPLAFWVVITVLSLLSPALCPLLVLWQKHFGSKGWCLRLPSSSSLDMNGTLLALMEEVGATVSLTTDPRPATRGGERLCD